MNEEILWKTRIVLQSVAVFVATSVFLGRIYFLTFHEELGLPVRDVPINILDYSIISPNVTLICLTFSILLGIFFVFRTQVRDMVISVKLKYQAGVILYFSTIVVLINVDRLYNSFGAEFPFLYGMLMSLVIILSALSGLFMGAHQSQRNSDQESGSSSIKTDTDTNGEPAGWPTRFFERLRRKCAGHGQDVSQTIQPLLPMIVVVSIIAILPWSASQVAKRDAFIIYENAPSALAKLVSEEPLLLDRLGGKNCAVCENTFHVGVIAMGERFIYLRQIDDETMHDVSQIFAIPIGDLEYLMFDSTPR